MGIENDVLDIAAGSEVVRGQTCSLRDLRERLRADLFVVMECERIILIAGSLEPFVRTGLTLDGPADTLLGLLRHDVGLLHHSDQGCTYASEDYQAVLARTASRAV